MKQDAHLIKYRLLSEAGLTLTDLASKIKRDPSTISMVIHGRRKSAYVMDEISKILDPDTPNTPPTCPGSLIKKQESYS